MSSGTDALVIGAGAVGASTAYHLAARGLSVTIVDQFDVASQTSPRAAGLSTTVTRDPSYAPFTQRSAEKLVNLHAETGHGIRFERSGTIRLTRNPSLVHNVRDEVEHGRRQGIVVEEIDHERASQLAPYLRADPALAMTYAPDELYLPNPGDVARAYVRAARDLGTEVVTGAKIEAFAPNDGRVVSALGAERSFSADAVVLCANAGNGRLVRMLGQQLPTIPLRHQLAITEPLPNVTPQQPQIKVVDGHVYVRPHGSSLLVGGFEPNPLVLSHEDAGDTDMERLELDAKPLHELLREVTDLFPTAASAGLRELRGGVISMTPDGQYILDRVRGFENVWIAAGDNAGANTTSPMIGQVIAEWIVDGVPSLDVDQFALDRFADTSDADAQRLAIHQYVDMIALD